MKYIIDVPDKAIELMGGHISILVEPVFKTGDCKYYTLRLSKEDIEPYTELSHKAMEHQHSNDILKVARMNYYKGAEDGWNLAIDIDRNTDNYDWQDMTYQEAKSNYESWKKENEIHVGDEVEYVCCDETVRFVVTGISNGSRAYGFKYPCEYDESGEYCDLDQLRKTGRHFDEIEELLKKMKEES